MNAFVPGLQPAVPDLAIRVTSDLSQLCFGNYHDCSSSIHQFK